MITEKLLRQAGYKLKSILDIPCINGGFQEGLIYQRGYGVYLCYRMGKKNVVTEPVRINGK